MLRRTVVIATSLLIVASNAGGQTPERFSLSGDAAIYNLAGSVRIEAGGAGAVVVEVTRGGADGARLSIESTDRDGWKLLRVLYPEDRLIYPRLGRGSRTQFNINRDGTFGRTGSGDEGEIASVLRLLRMHGSGNGRRITVNGSGSGLEAWADLRVFVPQGATVAVHLGAGEVNASNVDGQLIIDAQSGTVATTGTRGRLRIDTGSGSVGVSGADGDVTVDTGSGNVSLDDARGTRFLLDTGSGSITSSRVRSNVFNLDTGSGRITMSDIETQQLSVDTGSGDIKLAAISAAEITLDTGSGGVEVDLRTAPRMLNVDTGSGGVTLTLPRDISARVHLSSGSGGIDSELPITTTRFQRSEVNGTIGTGTGQLSVSTGSGGIRLRAR